LAKLEGKCMNTALRTNIIILMVKEYSQAVVKWDTDPLLIVCSSHHDPFTYTNGISSVDQGN